MLAACFLLEVYRAATQSLVHDEAFTYQHYLAAPFQAIFTEYDAIIGMNISITSVRCGRAAAVTPPPPAHA